MTFCLTYFRWLLICVLALTWISEARAQPFGKTAIASFEVAGATATGDAAALEAELQVRRIPVISMHDARDRFLAVSRPPQDPSGTELEALTQEARQAVEHVAFGRAAAAEKSVREIIALAERSLETLNRQTANARRLLDACLALVRSSLHEGQRQVAVEQAMGCRRLVPDLPPSESAHPASVVGVLAEADDELRRMRVGSLTVRDASSRACSVYLNGRHLGTTPFELDRAAVGTYRVQVECDEKHTGRVHVVALGDQPVELEVDTAFDDAVTTEPRVGVRYASAQQHHARLVSHASRLGRALRADDVILVGTVDGRPEVLRVNVKQGRLTSAVRLQSPAQPDAVRTALEVLTQGRFVGVQPDAYAARSLSAPTDVSPQALAAASPGSTSAGPGPADKPQPVYKKWWLWTTVGVVIAGGVVAGVLLGTRNERGKGSDEPVIDVPSQQMR